ncbi:MAG: hypothetical protein Fur003_3550 [Candidatus Dojkabacteria bacterium]
MSKLLLKILKNSLTPASLMIASKVLGIFIAVYFFDLPLTISHNATGIFTVELFFDTKEATLLANSISNLTLLLSMTVTGLFIYIKYYLYLRANGNPRTIVKLTKLNLLKWITSKEVGFIRMFTWAFFIFAANAIVASSSISQKTFGWIGISAFASTLLFMWGLVRTFELETATIYPNEIRPLL